MHGKRLHPRDTAGRCREENVELARRGMRSAEEFVGLLDDYVVRDNRAYPLIDVPDVEMGRGQLEAFMRHYWGTFEDYSLDATGAD